VYLGCEALLLGPGADRTYGKSGLLPASRCHISLPSIVMIAETRRGSADSREPAPCRIPGHAFRSNLRNLVAGWVQTEAAEHGGGSPSLGAPRSQGSGARPC
jgi:hypothetical protein